ncbi:MAG: glycosyltransferase family 39 protein [Candidatus Omnitrophica bacterium]|nr:glycosyltransferase family 39 protein [Candidatus Omnitrophota bacterium]
MSFIVRECFIPHIPQVYIDEFLWFVAGRSLSETHRLVWDVRFGSIQNPLYEWLIPRPAGYPFLESLIFKVFGASLDVVFQMNIFLASLTTIFIFGMAYILFQSAYVAFFSALIFSFLPAHLRFSACGNPDVAALLFLTMGVFFFLLYLKRKRIVSMYAAITALAFLVHVKPEYGVACIYFSVVAASLFKSGFFSKADLSTFILYLILLLLPLIGIIPAMVCLENEHAGHLFLSASALIRNTQENIKAFSTPWGFLFILGAIRLFIKDRLKWMALLGAFMVGFFLVQCYFEGARERYSLFYSVPLALIAGYGFSVLKSAGRVIGKVLTAFFCLSLLWTSFSITHETFERILQRDSYQEYIFIKKNLPRMPHDAYIVSINGEILLALGENDRKVVRLGEGVLNHVVPRVDTMVLYLGLPWHNQELWVLQDRNALRKTYKFITMVEKDIDGKKVGFYFLVKKKG